MPGSQIFATDTGAPIFVGDAVISRVDALERTVAEQGQTIVQQRSMIESLVRMHESLRRDVVQRHPSFPLPPIHPLIGNSGSSSGSSSNGMIVKREASPDDVRMVIVRTAEDAKEADEGRSTDVINAVDPAEPVVEGAETSMVVEVVDNSNAGDFPENFNVIEGIEGGTNVGSIESSKATESVEGAVVDTVIADTDVAVDRVVGDADGEGTRNDRVEQKIEESVHSYTPPGTPPMVPVFLNHEMLLTPLSVADQKLD